MCFTTTPRLYNSSFKQDKLSVTENIGIANKYFKDLKLTWAEKQKLVNNQKKKAFKKIK